MNDEIDDHEVEFDEIEEYNDDGERSLDWSGDWMSWAANN